MNKADKDNLEYQDLPKNIEVGQMWSVTWDGSEEKLIVIKKILDQKFLACPVTYENNFYPAIRVKDNSDYYVWPNIEFEYDYSLLDTYYGKYFEGKKFNALASSADEKTLDKIVEILKLDISHEDAPEIFLKDLLIEFESIKYKNLYFYIQRGSLLENPQLLQEALNVEQYEATRIAEGSQGISREQVNSLSKHINVNAEYLVYPMKNKYEEELSSPLWKDAIRLVMEKFSIGELETRRNASLWLMRPARAEGSIDSRILTYFNEALSGDSYE